METWKDIKEYNGLYQVSNIGNIKSLVKKTQKILAPISSMSGYQKINLYKNGVLKTKLIHRLVSESFIPNPENKPQVNHKNGIKTDNRVENLEWCTSSQNIQHAYANNLAKGRAGSNHHFFGVSQKIHPSSRKVIDNITGKIFDSCKQASEYFGINKTQLSAMLRGARRNRTNLRYYND